MADPTSPGMSSADASAIDAWLADGEPASAPAPDDGAPAAAPPEVPAAATSGDAHPIAASADSPTDATPDPSAAGGPAVQRDGDVLADLAEGDVLRDLQSWDEPPDLPPHDVPDDSHSSDVPDDLAASDVLGDLPSGEVLADVPSEEASIDPPAHDVLSGLQPGDMRADLPASDVLSGLQPGDVPADLPASDVPGGLQPGGVLADLPASDVLSGLQPDDVLADLPAGDLLADLQGSRAAADPPPAPEKPPESLLQAVTALDAKDGPVPAPASAPAPAPAPAPGARYVLFTVAGAQYAIHQTCVTELDRVPKITIVPNVPSWVRGVTNRRGDILSVVDTRSLLGLDRTDLLNARMLVVRLLDDSCSLGLLVDDVQQIASVLLRDIRPAASALEGPLAPFLAGLFELDQRPVAVLDMERLLRSPTIRQFDEPTEGTTDE